MKLGIVSTNSWTFRKVQAEICVMLVQVNVKCSCATYIMGVRISSVTLSYSVYKTTQKLHSNTTLRLSVC